eukprot:4028580-Prorocentrum_lima.AAC.1
MPSACWKDPITSLENMLRNTFSNSKGALGAIPSISNPTLKALMTSPQYIFSGSAEGLVVVKGVAAP